MSVKLDYPATQRNKEAILGVLRDVIPSGSVVLEIASGSGQHGVHFAANLPSVVWQPSSYEAEERASIEAYRKESGLDNLRQPVDLDVRETDWPVDGIDTIFCANMIHIAPWAAAEGLFAGAGRLLGPGGKLVTYGPYCFDGAFTADSNAAFDRRLRERDPSWGVRDLNDLAHLATAAELVLVDTIAMPANNHILVWAKKGA